MPRHASARKLELDRMAYRSGAEGLIPVAEAAHYTHGQLAVLVAIYDEFARIGECALSNEAIAERASVGDPTLHEALAVASGDRLIEIETGPPRIIRPAPLWRAGLALPLDRRLACNWLRTA